MSRQVTFALLLGISAMAFAASTDAAGQVTFESLDKNSDGKISLDEASVDEKLFVAFKQLDTNKDGALDKTEFAAYKAT